MTRRLDRFLSGLYPVPALISPGLINQTIKQTFPFRHNFITSQPGFRKLTGPEPHFSPGIFILGQVDDGLGEGAGIFRGCQKAGLGLRGDPAQFRLRPGRGNKWPPRRQNVAQFGRHDQV